MLSIGEISIQPQTLTEAGMSIREIKALFCSGLNAKVVMCGGDLAENSLRKAVHLSANINDDIWSNLPKYRLAHLLFRTAKNQKELEEVFHLLTSVSESTAHPVVLFGSRVLLLALSNRLKVCNSKIIQKDPLILIEEGARLLKRQEFQTSPNRDYSGNLQNDLLNMLELAVYFIGDGYEALDGLGLSDSYVSLLPNQPQSVWRIVEETGLLDELAYTKDLGKSELLRLVKFYEVDLYYIYGDREFKIFSQSNIELKTVKYHNDGTSVKTLAALHRNGKNGLSTNELSKVSGTVLNDPSKSRQIRKYLNELIEKKIISQISKGPQNSRFAISSDIRIIGFIAQQFA